LFILAFRFFFLLFLGFGDTYSKLFWLSDVVVVWVNLVIVVPSNLCRVVSNKPPSIDKFNIEGGFVSVDGVDTDILILRFYPVHLSFDFSQKVVCDLTGYDIDCIYV
jgi:hypothetical protein